jgi:putative ABC transport system substrate-binding protein
MISRKSIVHFALGGAMVLAFTFLAQAQQAKKIPRIGVLRPGSPADPSVDPLRQGLRELGYVEGKNIVIEYRYAEGKLDRLPDLVTEMVRLRPDVIVVGSTRVAEAAKQATSTIPIVVIGGDVVGAGLVSSLARPGGNVTGLTAISPDLSGKRLELLKDVVPKLSRVGVLWYPGRDEDEVKQTEIAGRTLGIAIQSVQVQAVEDFDSAYAAMKNERANGVILVQGGFTLFHRKQLAERAAKNRLPSIGETSTWTDDGCLMSYGPSQTDRSRRAATYVHKILQGAKPADLPVEQPTKFELTVNLKTAKQLGLTIPQSVLYRADKVIK